MLITLVAYSKLQTRNAILHNILEPQGKGPLLSTNQNCFNCIEHPKFKLAYINIVGQGNTKGLKLTPYRYHFKGSYDNNTPKNGLQETQKTRKSVFLTPSKIGVPNTYHPSFLNQTLC